jgi:hypothetical protein
VNSRKKFARAPSFTTPTGLYGRIEARREDCRGKVNENGAIPDSVQSHDKCSLESRHNHHANGRTIYDSGSIFMRVFQPLSSNPVILISTHED